MKRILITGANSYVGTSVENYLKKQPEKYQVATLDMKNEKWLDYDFSKFDVVFHVAGIAHVSTKKSLEDLYYKVNRDLTIKTANKAKSSGIKQFIFMSSMIVYNSRETKITIETKPNPDNFYGDSKLQAERGILSLQDSSFKVCVLRPPMIYGPNSKGNFPKLAKFADRTPVFPNFKNKRSMLYIDNLASVIDNLIGDERTGIFFPQNTEYSCTSEIVRTIAKLRNKKIWFIRLFNPFIYLTRNLLPVINKLFSDSYYDLEMSKELLDLNQVKFIDSINQTVGLIKQ